MLLQPRRRVVQPQGPVEIDWANPLTRGLVSALVPDGAGYVDYLRSASYPATSGLVRHSRPGKIVSLDGTGYTNLGVTSIGGVNLFASAASGSWSVVTCAKGATAGSTGTFLAKAGATDASKTLQIFRSGTGLQTPAVILRGTQVQTGWGFSDTDYHQYAVTFEAETAVAIAYGDADKQVALAIGGAAEQAENIVIGARTGGAGARLTGETSYTYFFSRALSQPEVASLYRNPWQIFRPLPARLLVDLSGPVSISRPGGGTDLGAWTSTDATLWQAIGETTPNDATFITSPELLAGAQASELIALTPPVAAGVLSVRLRAQRTQASGQLRVVLTAADGTPVGASAWQVLGSSYSPYTLPATTTGTATHFKFEVKL